MAAPPAPAPRARALPPLLVDFLAGGLGGVCSVVVGHPFDVVKTLLQLPRAPGAPRARALGVARAALAAGGARALLRGMGAPLAGVAPVFAVCFATYAGAKRAAARALGRAPHALPLPALALAGAASAVPTALLVAPGERLKVLVIAGAHAGPLAAARAVGARGLLRGAGATLARDAVGSAAYFAAYEAAARAAGGRRAWDGGGAGAPPPPPPGAAAALLGGAAAGAAHWLAAMPLDNVKTRVQAGAAGGAREAARAIWREGGWRGFYRGLAPALARALPAKAGGRWGVEGAGRVWGGVG